MALAYKIFYTIKKKKDLKASEKYAKCLKILHGKFRHFANVIQMFAKEKKPLAVKLHMVGEAFPRLSILH